MQYILSQDEYDNLKTKKKQVWSDKEIMAYFRRIPHFGPATINSMIEYMKTDKIFIFQDATE